MWFIILAFMWRKGQNQLVYKEFDVEQVYRAQPCPPYQYRRLDRQGAVDWDQSKMHYSTPAH